MSGNSARRDSGFTVLAALFVLLCSPSTRAVSVPEADQTALVVRVVDGDTLVLGDLGTVRLIGIDTPETVDPRVPVQAFGVEAAAVLREMVEGQEVRVEYDTQRFDKYHRTLAYLYLPDGTFVNLEMVRQGYAHAYLTYPFRYMEEFRSAEREAREAGRGLWGPSATAQSAVSTPSAPIQVWVNASSRVYHCPGTRYYGTTARGEFMTEAEAQQKGNRAAYGRSCGAASASTPASTGDIEAPQGRSPAAAATAPAVPTTTPGNAATKPAQGPSVRVWVNTSSGVYHCPGTRYYGNTKSGTYMPESEADSRGYRAAYGRRCS